MDAINHAQLLGLDCACKPDVAANIVAFLDRCRESIPWSALIHELAVRVGLTKAETRILSLAVESTTHDFLLAKTDIMPNTLKTHIRAILTKTFADSLEDLVVPLRAKSLRR